MTAGMISLRKSAGEVIGVYEAKSTFTASGDPSTDTTHWRACGLTGTEWKDYEPILKWTIRAVWTVGTGWELPTAAGFPHRWQGTVCRNGAALRIALADNGGSFGHVVTDNDWWEDYTGAVRADCDYDFSRYCVLEFAVGDLVARGTAFYRCKAAVDHAGSADGTGDPATDTTHWEAYVGNRSVWFDFTDPASSGYSAPFNQHKIPSPRYSTWTESVTVYDDDDSVLGEFTNKIISRDILTGDLSIDDCDNPSFSVNVDLPAPPVLTNPDRPATPSVPGYTITEGDTGYFAGWFTETVNLKVVDSFNLSVANGLVVSASPVVLGGYGYTSKYFGGTYPVRRGDPPSGYGMNVIYSRDQNIMFETWESMAAAATLNERPPTWRYLSDAGGYTMGLSNVTLSPTRVDFEYTVAVEWYHNTTVRFDFVYYGTVASQWDATCYGLTAISALSRVYKTIKIVQSVTLSDAIDDGDFVDAILGFLPSFPAYGVRSDVAIARHGIPMTVNSGTVFSTSYESNLYLNVAKTGFNGGDTRLVENETLLAGFTCDMVTAHHWTIEQTQGSAAVPTEYHVAGTHSFTPTDDALKWAKVTISAP